MLQLKPLSMPETQSSAFQLEPFHDLLDLGGAFGAGDLAERFDDKIDLGS